MKNSFIKDTFLLLKYFLLKNIKNLIYKFKKYGELFIDLIDKHI